VAAAAGVNIATLHYYFPTKESLIAAVLAHAMEKFRSTLSATGSPAHQIRGHLKGVHKLVDEEPELFAVMAELALRSSRDPAIRNLYQQTVEIWRATIRGLLSKGRKDGSIPGQTDVGAQASLVVAALMGACMIPVGRADRLNDTVQELERYLGLRRR
jgi:AcrR family transcriptional regulator